MFESIEDRTKKIASLTRMLAFELSLYIDEEWGEPETVAAAKALAALVELGQQAGVTHDVG